MTPRHDKLIDFMKKNLNTLLTFGNPTISLKIKKMKYDMEKPNKNMITAPHNTQSLEMEFMALIDLKNFSIIGPF